jgi:hypothetical protein
VADKIADFYRVMHSLTNEQLVATVNKLEDVLYQRKNGTDICPDCKHHPTKKTMSISMDDSTWVCRGHGPLTIGKRGIFYRPHHCDCRNKCHNKKRRT